MTASAAGNWQETNKAALANEFDAVKRELRARLNIGEESVRDGGRVVADQVRTLHEVPDGFSLDRVAAVFGLSRFERSVLAFCAGAEMDGELGVLCGRANGDPRLTTPTFSLALAILPEPHWSALAPAAPLRRFQMLRLDGDGPLTSTPLRVDERVLHYLLGVNYLPRGLVGRVRLAPQVHDLPAAYEEVLAKVRAALSDGDSAYALLQLQGDARRGARALATVAIESLGGAPFIMSGSGVPATLDERVDVARLWEREAALTGGVLLVEHEGGQCPPRALIDFIDELAAPIVFIGEAPLTDTARVPLRVPVPRLGAQDQLQTWTRYLTPLPTAAHDAVARVVYRFDLPSEEIAKLAHATRRGGHSHRELAQQLHAACRIHSRPAMDGLAERLDTAAGWEDLVLPERSTILLRQMAAQLEHQFTVMHAWGFAAKLRQGLGITALFSGASGTGKTLAAQVLASVLQLDLYRIDLSAVVSKYIGETEKNLRRVFDAAEAGGAVLLFDEADALFGRRGEVKDSHDRYANIEVGYLLQRMESFGGLAILTTNLKENLDGAFLRRLRFVVEFPFPGLPQRQAMWQRMFPTATPTESLDPALLAQLQLVGGNIRNIALNAAFLAAGEGAPVSMRHIRRAVLVEYAKLERALNPNELAGWPQ